MALPWLKRPDAVNHHVFICETPSVLRSNSHRWQDGECDVCEADAVDGVCADRVLECEADVAAGGCAELATCVEACADGEGSECLDACFDLADKSAVSLLDDVFVCIAEECFLC